MYGPEGNNAWWLKLKSGRHHLTTLGSHNNIYPACTPDVWWRDIRRSGWEIVFKDASRIPDNACQMCQCYAVIWGML